MSGVLVFITDRCGVTRCSLCDHAVDDPDAHAWEVHDVFPTAVLVVTDA